MEKAELDAVYQQIREVVPIAPYLERAKHGGLVCPNCGSGTGINGHSTGAGKYYDDSKKLSCHVCGKTSDVIDFYAKENGLGNFEAARELAEKNGIDWPSSTGEPSRKSRVDVSTPKASGEEKRKEEAKQEAQRQENLKLQASIMAGDRGLAFAYLKSRGISRETVEPLQIGAQDGKVYFFKGDGEYNARITQAGINNSKEMRYLKSKGKHSHLWGEEALTGKRPVFVAESEIDALSLMEVGAAAVALSGTGNAGQFVSKTQKAGAIVISVMDNDEAGSAATLELKAAGFIDGREILSGLHDVNDALLADRQGLAEGVARLEAAYSYDKNSMAGRLALIRQKIANTTTFASTGFKNLDKILGGGLYSGLYVIGAISSAGKTTFTLQLADNVAKQGQDVLFFSLEMAEEELAAKSISRIMSKGSFKPDTRHILTGKGYKAGEDEAIAEAWQEYLTYCGNLFVIQGVGDVTTETIRAAVAKHVRWRGKAPFVVVDYTQIIAGDSRRSDKQNTDKAVLELKRISRDYSVPVWAVSSFNRENYSASVNMASFKESGAIEYSADVLIGLQFYGMDRGFGENGKDYPKRIAEMMADNKAKAKNGVPVTIELKVLKNRNGYTSSAYFDFVAKNNVFTENKNPGALDYDEPVYPYGAYAREEALSDTHDEDEYIPFAIE